MKAQTGIETLFILAFFILVFVMAFTVYIDRYSDIQFTKTYLGARKNCHTVKNVIDQLVTNGYGSAIKFFIPNKVGDSDYTLSVNALDNTILVVWGNSSVSCGISTKNVTNTSANYFYIKKGENIGENKEGNIIIRSA